MCSDISSENQYFLWLCSIVLDMNEPVTYNELMIYLYEKPFRYILKKDLNRAKDGEDLRLEFVHPVEGRQAHYLEKPCSMLEMLVALAVRCEKTIMADPRYGDRTKQWFWGMVKNLGLSSMNDTRFDYDKVDGIVERFLNRKYEPDGTGGLFHIRDCDKDLRKVEIWNQLCWYLDYRYGDN